MIDKQESLFGYFMTVDELNEIRSKGIKQVLLLLGDGDWHRNIEIMRFLNLRNDPLRRVRELRDYGFEYQCRRSRGSTTAFYRLTSYDRQKRVRVTDKLKNAYYATRHWRETRQKRREFDQHQCTLCHRKERLQVHHWKYDLFAEHLRHLQTLCDRCHVGPGGIHSICEGAGVGWPKFVTEEIRDKILDATS